MRQGERNMGRKEAFEDDRAAADARQAGRAVGSRGWCNTEKNRQIAKSKEDKKKRNIYCT